MNPFKTTEEQLLLQHALDCLFKYNGKDGGIVELALHALDTLGFTMNTLFIGPRGLAICRKNQTFNYKILDNGCGEIKVTPS